MLCGFTEIKDNLFIIRCAIKFYINIINIVFVYRQFFLPKKWTKVRTEFFYLILNFDFERASGIIFKHRPSVKMIDFHGEVTFISVFDGVRDIFEVWFITKLCF
jgi:hypothetical protein